MRIGMSRLMIIENLARKSCDPRWTVAGWAVASRVAGLLRLLDDSFSLPTVQPVCPYA
jgi:hypothetical protein